MVEMVFEDKAAVVFVEVTVTDLEGEDGGGGKHRALA
jgi:hypothetical protein